MCGCSHRCHHPPSPPSPAHLTQGAPVGSADAVSPTHRALRPQAQREPRSLSMTPTLGRPLQPPHIPPPSQPNCQVPPSRDRRGCAVSPAILRMLLGRHAAHQTHLKAQECAHFCRTSPRKGLNSFLLHHHRAVRHSERLKAPLRSPCARASHSPPQSQAPHLQNEDAARGYESPWHSEPLTNAGGGSTRTGGGQSLLEPEQLYQAEP